MVNSTDYSIGGGYNLPFTFGTNNENTNSYLDAFSNYGSGMQGNTGNMAYPTPGQFEMFREAGLNPISGEAIKPQSFADMSGLQKLSAGMSMIGNLSNIWSGIQQNRLARDNFDFQKGVMNTNLANQIASYNTALEDRVAGRYSDRERAANQAEINDYLDRNRAVNRMG